MERFVQKYLDFEIYEYEIKGKNKKLLIMICGGLGNQVYPPVNMINDRATQLSQCALKLPFFFSSYFCLLLHQI